MTALRDFGWRLALMAACLSVVVVLAKTGLWVYAGVPHVEPLFADLYATVAVADCNALGIDTYLHNPCDPYDRFNLYGPLWVHLHDIGITRADVPWLGSITVAAFFVIGSLVLAPRRAWQAAVSVLVLLSPAMLLAADRGNVDIYLFLLAAAAAWLFAKGGRVGIALGCVALWLATALKYYPIAGLAGLAAACRRWKGIGYGLLATLLVMVPYFWSIRAEMAIVQAQSPNVLPGFSFGGELLFVSLGLPHVRVLSLVSFLISLVIAWRLAPKLDIGRDATPWQVSSFLVGGGIVLGLFFLTRSFDYKLIFAVLMFPALFTHIETHFRTRVQARWLAAAMALFVLTLWEPEIRGVLHLAHAMITGSADRDWIKGEAGQIVFVLVYAGMWVADTVLLAVGFALAREKLAQVPILGRTFRA